MDDAPRTFKSLVIATGLLVLMGSGCAKSIAQPLPASTQEHAENPEAASPTSTVFLTTDDDANLHASLQADSVDGGCFNVEGARAVLVSSGPSVAPPYSDESGLLKALKDYEHEGWTVEEVCLKRANKSEFIGSALLSSKAGQAIAFWNSATNLPVSLSHPYNGDGRIMLWQQSGDMEFVPTKNALSPTSYGYTVLIHGTFGEGETSWDNTYVFDPTAESLKQTKACTTEIDLHTEKQTTNCKTF